MTHKVSVCVDFKSPYAWLAIAPTRALEAKLQTHFDWRPLIVPPLPKPKPAGANESRGDRHRRLRNEYHAHDLERYAESRGLKLTDPFRNPDTTLASLGLLWLRKTEPERCASYVEAMFDFVWLHGANIEHTNPLESADFAAYCKSDGPAELEASQRELEGQGIWNVPAYLVAGEILIGRAHLPLVEKLART
jgi:2-hydroxychromene-2-carboxylate isomerase